MGCEGARAGRRAGGGGRTVPDLPPLLSSIISTVVLADFYLLNKSSSSMAAALLVGAPLITEDRRAHRQAVGEAAPSAAGPLHAAPACPTLIKTVSLFRPKPPLCRRVLGAYQYVPDDAAFAYRSLLGDTWPDPVALAAAEGIRQSRLLHRLATAGRQSAGRRLVEAVSALVPAWHRLLRGHLGSGSSRLSSSTSSWSSGGQQGWRRSLAAKEQQAGKRGPREGAKPPAGSYAAALLHALDDDASRAAHTAAWRAKRAAMDRNAATARRILQETAAWAAAAADS